MDAKGCPQGTKEIPADNWVLKGGTFETGSDVIQAEGKAILDEAAAILLPRISVCLEVQGHTDNTGTDASNNSTAAGRDANRRIEFKVLSR